VDKGVAAAQTTTASDSKEQTEEEKGEERRRKEQTEEEKEEEERRKKQAEDRERRRKEQQWIERCENIRQRISLQLPNLLTAIHDLGPSLQQTPLDRIAEGLRHHVQAQRQSLAEKIVPLLEEHAQYLQKICDIPRLGVDLNQWFQDLNALKDRIAEERNRAASLSQSQWRSDRAVDRAGCCQLGSCFLAMRCCLRFDFGFVFSSAPFIPCP
jgi:hypothetical protein